MKKQRQIEDIHIRYIMLNTYAKFFFKKFYSKIRVFGLENIPHGDPIIFAPNHQNAVMDPLAILFTAKEYIVFLARSDVFKGKRLIAFLTLCKILPVYRQRDGVENLTKNEEIFNTTVRVLKKSKPICLMAEGSHGNKNHLRPLVKGMFRIAFSAQSELPDQNKSVKIVPVGLYYEHYVKFNKELVINYGKPISVKDYFSTYQEKPALAINQLKNDISNAMSEYMIDVKDLKNYDPIYFLSCEYPKHLKYKGKRKDKALQKYKSQQKVIHVLEKAKEENTLFLPQLFSFVESYRSLLKKYKLRDWILAKKRTGIVSIIINLITLIILSPLFLYGLIINYIPYISSKPVLRKLKDVQFHSSASYLISVIVIPLYYIILAIIVGIISKSILIPLGFLIISPITGFVAINTAYIFKKTIGKMRFIWKSLFNKKQIIELKSLRNKIMIIMDHLYNKNT